MKSILPLLLLAVAPAFAAVELYVSPTAAAGGDGSAAKPFQTIDAARVAAREHRDQPVNVNLGTGRYLLRDGIAFTAGDSGSEGRRVTYRAGEGANPEIVSGLVVPPDAIRPVSDDAVRARFREDVRDQIREVSLADLGIEVKRFPDNFRGLELLELFWDGNRLPISRWPDGGTFAKMAEVTNNGINPPQGGVFVYSDEAPARWVGALEEGVWLRGFWRVPWTIEAIRIASIDPETKTITMAAPISGGIGSKYHRNKDGVGRGSGEEPWEAINLIEEINVPGEWAVRFDTQKLYFLPPTESGELIITDNRDPIISLANASYITLENLSVACGLGDGIRIEGGEDVLVAGCDVSNVAKTGITIRGGQRHTLLSNDVSDTGLAGIDFLGGNRQTLEPAGHRIMNNLITKTGKYFPIAALVGGRTIRAESVGNYVAFNRIHDASNSGVLYAGNDNLFEYNDVYRVGLGSNDLGSFYTTGGWTSRGNIVRYNFVHHSLNANAFYVDDGDSGDTFYGNVAYKTESGGFVGGGHDQIFKNNIIIDSPRAMHVDSRGVPRGYTADDKRLRGDLDSVPYQAPPWSEKYPSLVKILDTPPEYPTDIVITDNLFVNCVTPLRKSGKENELTGITFENNVESTDLGMFVDPENFNFALKPDAAVFTQIPGFQPIPFEKIGLYPDYYRPVVPPRDLALLKSGQTDRGFDSQTDIDASNRK